MTPEDLLRAAHERMDAWEPGLAAVVERTALTGAAEGPLAGVVAGIKDLIEVAGVRRRCGAPAELTPDAPAPRHATVVQRLLDAGAVIAGTLSLHQFAYGITSPGVGNPRAPGRVAGGSSGGSAAAVAAGLVDVSLGTDTGGSVRIPASCCGVVGLKTTVGLVPTTGVQPLAWTLDTVGPLASSVAGAAAVLAAITGPDEDDPASVPDAVAAGWRSLLGEAVRRVGVPRQAAAQPVDDDVRGVSEHALSLLRGDGIDVVDVDLPGFDLAPTASGRILAAEAAAVHGDSFRATPQLWPDSIGPRLQLGLDLDAVTVARARRRRTEWQADLRRTFASVDVLVLPTLPCLVPPVDTARIVVGGREEDVTPAMTRFTNPWNLAGVPAGSIPAGRDAAGAPIGLQVVGPAFGEHLVLDAMARLEHLLGGPWPPAPAPPPREV